MIVATDTVLKSTRVVVEHATDVTINHRQIECRAKEILDDIKQLDYSPSLWKTHPLHPKVANEAAIDWYADPTAVVNRGCRIFLCDLLNFSFWPNTAENRRYAVDYNGVRYTGYWALCAALNRSIDEENDVTEPKFYGTEATYQDLDYIFRPDAGWQMPMLSERIAIMRQAGRVLVEKYDGSFKNCLVKAQGDALVLLNLIITDFPSFFDVSWHHGQTVFFLKRAQILVADIWSCFEDRSFGAFTNIDKLTMFADYRVPQILCALDILEYSPRLSERLKSKTLLPAGSLEEAEIRAASIWAVELLMQQIRALDPSTSVNSVIVDYYLWVRVARPFHLHL